MKEFVYPEIELVEFEVEDVVNSSLDPEPDNPEGGLGWG